MSWSNALYRTSVLQADIFTEKNVFENVLLIYLKDYYIYNRAMPNEPVLFFVLVFLGRRGVGMVRGQLISLFA